MGARLGQRQILLQALPPQWFNPFKEPAMTPLIYWFRNDLRLHDNPAFAKACAQANTVLPVYCLGSASAVHNGDTHWGVMQSPACTGNGCCLTA